MSSTGPFLAQYGEGIAHTPDKVRAGKRATSQFPILSNSDSAADQRPRAHESVGTDLGLPAVHHSYDSAGTNSGNHVGTEVGSAR